MIFQRTNVLGVAKRYLFNNFRSAAMSSQTPAAKKLDGKVAIVTASTDGIGFAIARKLAIDGAKVVVSSRKQNNVDKAVSLLEKEGLKVFGMPCHVGSKNDRDKLINETAERFGGIDILVSNAAVNPTFGSILDCTEEIWDKIFEINVKSAFLLVKSVVPHMEKRGGGSIVLVSSIAGFQPITALGAYSVSKTALLGLTKALAMQLGPDNIRVNCLAPGIVQTKFSGALVDDQTIRSRMEEQIPLRRIAQPNEMGGLVSFLCSEDASYITGENILVCGGMPSRL